MMKDKEWLKEEVLKLQKEANTRNEYGSNYSDEQLVLKKALSLIDQLEEPEKPVVPQFVADWIESYRKKTLVELINDAVYSSDEDSKCFRRWFHEEMGFESSYSEFISRAWLDGYEVEEEQKYYVSVRDEEYGGFWFLSKNNNGNISIGVVRDCSEVDWDRLKLTEQEIKDYNERFWSLAEEVTE